MAAKIVPKPGSGFDPIAIGWEGPDEPPGDICSYCGDPLADDAVPLIVWDDRGWTARFCDPCVDRYFTVVT